MKNLPDRYPRERRPPFGFMTWGDFINAIGPIVLGLAAIVLALGVIVGWWS